MSTMIPIAFAQRATALTIINTPTETRAVGTLIRRHQRDSGRTVMDGDEVFSVAQLLGDLVSYRASGKGHLELLAGLALLRRESLMPKVQVETVDAPTELIQGAIDFHPFAEAAYTGPLLDVGRNPLFFLCAWLHRQGHLYSIGDKWWRGSGRAFLKFVNLLLESPSTSRGPCSTRCEAAYFVVVFHHIKCVVICVRGTETPEDLLTDGLSRECMLATEDFDGLIQTRVNHRCRSDNLIPPGSIHYGHSGIVEAARDLYEQIDGNPKNKAEFQEGGLLTSLLGAGCECEGYDLRVVGHSLGGAIAAMLGLKKVARRFLSVSTFLCDQLWKVSNTSPRARVHYLLKGENTGTREISTLALLCTPCIDSSDDGNDSSYRLSNNFDQSRNSVNSRASFVSQFMEAMPSQKDESSENFKEMFLAGTVIHIVPEKKIVDIPLYKRWATPDAQCGYEAYVANREAFKDMIVSPSMFIDHLPWR
ncbi:Sn1-specific diacylglycerol lipase beta isoform X3 [Tanacetum coccineum]